MRGGAPAIRSTPQDLPEGIPHEGTSEQAPLKARERGLLLVEVRARVWLGHGPNWVSIW